MKNFLKIFAIILIVLIILVGIYIYSKLNKISYKKISEENISINSGVEENLKEYRNIAILGIDSDEDNYEGTRRSDCIIIVSINNTTKETKLVSVYRDTYLNIQNYGLDKVNHSYAYGEEQTTINTLNENLDMDITEYITINFEVVRDVVDSIGGVEITVTDKETSQITKIDSAGTYNLTGEQALQYGRIRKIDNDYVRTERMRTVLTAVFEKAKQMGTIKLISLIENLLPEVETNISKTEILELVTTLSKYKVTTSIGWPYEVKGITLNAWYAVPITLEDNVTKLHKELFNETNYKISEKVKVTSQDIINKTGYR